MPVISIPVDKAKKEQTEEFNNILKAPAPPVVFQINPEKLPKQNLPVDQGFLLPPPIEKDHGDESEEFFSVNHQTSSFHTAQNPKEFSSTSKSKLSKEKKEISKEEPDIIEQIEPSLKSCISYEDASRSRAGTDIQKPKAPNKTQSGFNPPTILD